MSYAHQYDACAPHGASGTSRSSWSTSDARMSSLPVRAIPGGINAYPEGSLLASATASASAVRGPSRRTRNAGGLDPKGFGAAASTGLRAKLVLPDFHLAARSG